MCALNRHSLCTNVVGNGQKDMTLNRIIIIATFLFCITTVVSGQEIKLNVISFNPCTSIYEHDLLVTLFKDNRAFQIADTLGTFHLPEPGTYKLRLFEPNFYRLTDSVKFIQIKSGQNYDTLTFATILKCVYVGGHKSGDCGISLLQ